MLHGFVRDKFIPSRMALSVVANMDLDKLEQKVLGIIAKVQAFPSAIHDVPSVILPSSVILSEAKNLSHHFNKVIDKHHHEVNAVIGGYAPSLYEMPDRLVAAMLCNILGGPASNSLLNAELREKRGWVYGIECNYTQYADSGVVAISFGCDKPNLDACMAAIDKILAGLRDKPLSQARLRSFRKQLIGQLAISSEAGEAQCLSLGKSILSWGEVMSSAQIRNIIDSITPAQLQAMAQRLFTPANLSSLIYL